MPRKRGGENWLVSLVGPNGIHKTIPTENITDHGDGTYGVLYSAERPGEYVVLHSNFLFRISVSHEGDSTPEKYFQTPYYRLKQTMSIATSLKTRSWVDSELANPEDRVISYQGEPRINLIFYRHLH